MCFFVTLQPIRYKLNLSIKMRKRALIVMMLLTAWITASAQTDDNTERLPNYSDEK